MKEKVTRYVCYWRAVLVRGELRATDEIGLSVSLSVAGDALPATAVRRDLGTERKSRVPREERWEIGRVMNSGSPHRWPHRDSRLRQDDDDDEIQRRGRDYLLRPTESLTLLVRRLSASSLRELSSKWQFQSELPHATRSGEKNEIPWKRDVRGTS